MSVNESHDINNSQSNSNASCNTCGSRLITNRGLLLHLNACRRKQQEQENQQLGANNNRKNTHQLQNMPCGPINKPFYWKGTPGTTFVNK